MGYIRRAGEEGVGTQWVGPPCASGGVELAKCRKLAPSLQTHLALALIVSDAFTSTFQESLVDIDLGHRY